MMIHSIIVIDNNNGQDTFTNTDWVRTGHRYVIFSIAFCYNDNDDNNNNNNNNNNNDNDNNDKNNDNDNDSDNDNNNNNNNNNTVWLHIWYILLKRPSFFIAVEIESGRFSVSSN